MPLTPKQAKFVAAYVAEPNATRAAIAAGYSEKTAYSAGPRLLGSVEIQQALQQANVTALQRVQSAQDEAVASVEWIVKQAIATHKQALSDGQFGPAVSALGLLTKLYPEFSEKHEVKAEVDLVERRYIGIEVHEV